MHDINKAIAIFGKCNIWFMVLVMNLTGWIFPIFLPELSIRIYQQIFPPYLNQIEVLKDNLVIDLGHRILGGLLFLLGAIQFESKIRKQAPKIHRMSGYLYIGLGYCISFTASYMAIFTPYSGFPESVLVIAISLIYASCITFALKSALIKKYSLHREWMIRGYAIASFIYVMRIFSNIFYHFGVTASGPEIFLASSILAFGFNYIIAEWWISRTRK